MNYVINHKNYPDYCKITTKNESYSQFSDNSDVSDNVLYEGECKKYGSSQMRKYVNGNVVKADFCVDIPYVVKGIDSGMFVTYEDASGTRSDIEIVSAYADDVFKLGTTVFFNVTMN